MYFIFVFQIKWWHRQDSNQGLFGKTETIQKKLAINPNPSKDHYLIDL